jgi:hypothetical protein
MIMTVQFDSGYIYEYYGVPAKVGGRVLHTHNGRQGTIKGARGQYLLIQLDGDDSPGVYHPTWEMEYLDSKAKAQGDKT